MAPPKPVFDKGPSMFSLVTNVAMAGIKGYQYGKEELGLRGFGASKDPGNVGGGIGGSTSTDTSLTGNFSGFNYEPSAILSGDVNPWTGTSNVQDVGSFAQIYN